VGKAIFLTPTWCGLHFGSSGGHRLPPSIVLNPCGRELVLQEISNSAPVLVRDGWSARCPHPHQAEPFLFNWHGTTVRISGVRCNNSIPSSFFSCIRHLLPNLSLTSLAPTLLSPGGHHSTVLSEFAQKLALPLLAMSLCPPCSRTAVLRTTSL
jgi:hypothetical protein